MKVSELIEELNKYNKDAIVCIGYDFDLEPSITKFEKGHVFTDNEVKYYGVPKELNEYYISLW